MEALEEAARPQLEANQDARHKADETVRKFREFEMRMRASGVWPTDLMADRPDRDHMEG